MDFFYKQFQVTWAEEMRNPPCDIPISYVAGLGRLIFLASLLEIKLGFSRPVYTLSLTHYLPLFLSKISRRNWVPKYAVL